LGSMSPRYIKLNVSIFFSEYGDVRTANQFANRVYGAFTAIEQ